MLPNDVILNIFRYIDRYIDILNYCHISKNIYMQAININFLEKKKINIMKSRLKEAFDFPKLNLKITGNKFIKALKKSEAIIAGSFPLQCMLNEKWKYSDIDIYYKYDNSNKYEIYNILKLSYKNEYSSKDLYDNIKKYIAGVKYYILKSNNKYLVINFIETWNNPREIIEDFDLSFCRTVFDGKTVEIPRGIFEKKGIIKDVEYYENRFASDFSNNKYNNNILGIAGRVYKYMKRGFYIININNFIIECMLYHLFHWANFGGQYILGIEKLREAFINLIFEKFNWNTFSYGSFYQIGIKTGPNNDYICIKKCDNLEDAIFYESPKISDSYIFKLNDLHP